MNTQERISLTVLERLSIALVTVGAINWGLIGLSEFVGGNLNVVNQALGGFPTVEALVYLVVGLAGLYVVYVAFQLNAARTARLPDPAEPEPRA